MLLTEYHPGHLSTENKFKIHMVNLSFEITVRAGPRIQFGCLGFLHTSILVTLFTGSQFQTWRRIQKISPYR